MKPLTKEDVLELAMYPEEDKVILQKKVKGAYDGALKRCLENKKCAEGTDEFSIGRQTGIQEAMNWFQKAFGEALK